MFRRIFIFVLIFAISFSNFVYGLEGTPSFEDEFAEFIFQDDEFDDNFPITLGELGSPIYLTAEILADDILLSWTNYTSVFFHKNDYKIEYQIDFKVGRGSWASEDPRTILPTGELEINSYGKSSTYFNPSDEGLHDDEIIDIQNNNYSIRVRYLYTYNHLEEEKYLQGRFSSPINLGLQPYYQNASTWALKELDNAAKLGFITEKIRLNMNENITREEFCELVMKLYYELSGINPTYSINPFIDTNNPEVLKAAQLGIVDGVGESMFAPDSPVTRQEIAVMIKRVLSLVDHTLGYYSYTDVDYLDKRVTSIWALDEMGFAISKGIILGDNGRTNPLGHSTREQAAIMILRTYENFR